MKYPLLLLSLLVGLSSCASTDPGGEGGGAALRAVAGTWRFSHFGPPTVSTPGADPSDFMRDYVKDSTILLKETGEASMTFSGQAQSFRVRVVEDTELYTKVGLGRRPKDEAFVYDKRTQFLMMPTKLKVEGSKGILPTYFKR